MIETPLRPRFDLSDGWEFVRGRVSRRWIQGRKRGGESVDLERLDAEGGVVRRAGQLGHVVPAATRDRCAIGAHDRVALGTFELDHPDALPATLDAQLCLAGGRFAVQAFWKESPRGPTFQARAVPLTGDTGYFWFFDEANLEVDYSYSVQGLARFRVNCFHHDRGVGGAFRTIPDTVWTLEDIGAPPIFRDIIDAPRGLILMTGPTGSGKSTTLAAMIDHLNNLVEGHVLTIEDPIEFVHRSKKCVINQREVHRDTHGFNQALRAALREDPDIILVGEMRDIETIRLALTAAETGHLVFSTLHTNDAPQSMTRLMNMGVPGYNITSAINLVIAQRLVRTLHTCRKPLELPAEALLQATRDPSVAQDMAGVMGSWAEMLGPRLAVAQERGVVRAAVAVSA